MSGLRIVCSESVAEARAVFSRIGEVTLVPEESLRREDLARADLLVTRSKRRIDRALLEGTPVRFYGAATAGFDHVDHAWLDDAGIAWTCAPGCNAASVADYVLASLLWLSETRGLDWAGRTLGIVGVGQIGSRLAARAPALGLTVVGNDPPRGAAGDPGPFVEIDELLARADVITLHVPLTDHGPCPTRGMVDRAWLARTKPGCVWINASRGEVVVEPDWLDAQRRGRFAAAVLDVFDREPGVSVDMIRAADLATPHIAGYSLEGRIRGTVQVFEAACRFAGLEASPPDDLLPPMPPIDPAAGLWGLVRQVYDPSMDSLPLHEAARGEPPEAIRDAFQRHRKHYPVRREIGSARLEASAMPPSLCEAVRILGFGGMADA